MQIYLPIAETSVSIFVLLGLGLTVGILSGMFGMGGGFIPMSLLFMIGTRPAVAVGTRGNLSGAFSFSGALTHFKKKTVDFAPPFFLFIGGVACALISAQIGLTSGADMLGLLFASLVIVTGGKIALELLLQSGELYSVLDTK